MLVEKITTEVSKELRILVYYEPDDLCAIFFEVSYLFIGSCYRAYKQRSR